MSKLPSNKEASWGIVALSLLFLAACAPSRTVYIPPEWQQKPARSADSTAPPRPRAQAAAPTGQASASSAQPFLLKRPPAIRESEIAPVEQPAAPPTAPAEKKPAQPQRMASMHLVDQANAALAEGKFDSAISLFEQAVQVDVYNGSAFFGLARAWRAKGSREKAKEFARKAEILFQDDRTRLKELYLFEANLYKELGDRAREDVYRQKASRL